MKFRKKPVVIEAIQFTDLSSINRMCNIWQKSFMDAADYDAAVRELYIHKRENKRFR